MSKIRKSSELTAEEYDQMMDAAGVLGFKLLILGLFTLGLGPIIYFWIKSRNERKEAK